MCECCICLDPIRFTRSEIDTPCCHHKLHARCFQMFILAGSEAATCPLCREPLPHEFSLRVTQRAPLHVVRAAVEAYHAHVSELSLAERLELERMQLEFQSEGFIS